MILALVLLVVLFCALYLAYGKMRWLDEPEVYQDRDQHVFHDRYQASERAAACESVGHDFTTNETNGDIECQRCGRPVPPGSLYVSYSAKALEEDIYLSRASNVGTYKELLID